MTSAEYATRYIEAGLNVIPIRPDGSKAPLIGEWKRYQDTAVAAVDIAGMFTPGCGLAAICGQVSGNLEVIDFDDAATFAAWSHAVDATAGPELFKRLTIVQTPRPGFHVYLRAKEIAGSQKLAMVRLDGSAPKALIETKGEGGYVLLPGSPPECHETRNLYQCIQGRFSQIPLLTPEERESLLTCARSFNQIRREETTRTIHPVQLDAKSPGNDFAAQTEWRDLLQEHGYKFAYSRGDEAFWTRPGKGHGVSASTNFAGNGLFYPFSTNCYPFESDKSYSKFAFYAVMEHAGDFSRAARSLADKGFGAPRIDRKPTPATKTDLIEPSELRARVMALYENGLQPGTSPGFPSLAQYWTLRRGEWTLATGIPSHGKSALIDNVMINTAIHAGWRWAVWSGENRPHELHVANLISIFTGKPFREGPHQRMSPDEMAKAMDFIEDRFVFVNPPEDEDTVERIIEAAEIAMKDGEIHGLIIDPWNELDHQYQDTETEYISRKLKRVRRFAARYSVHAIIVAHPQKLRKNQDGSYPIPTPYDVSGSGHWRNKADCAICVWRDEYQPGTGTVHIQKIRRSFVGKIGSVDLRYDIVTGRFIDPTLAKGDDEGWTY